MNQTETALETQRALFVAHQTECHGGCRHFNHSAKAMTRLCYEGTSKFLALLAAEDDYIKKIYKVGVEGAPQTLRKRAAELAIYGRLMQM